MIKLESKSSGIAAISELRIQSAGTEPTLALSTEGYRHQVAGEWTEDASRRKQVLTYLSGSDPVQIAGVVHETAAVEISAAWAVVVEVQLSMQLLSTSEAGRKSRSLVSVDLVRVVEVWGSPTKCLWQAPDRAKAGAKSAATMDENGKIKAA